MYNIVQRHISASPKLASLIGHYFGDGCIQKGHNQFKYANKDKTILDSVVDSVNCVFGKIKFSETVHDNGVHILVFPSLVARTLKLYGAIDGERIYQNFNVPDWIMNGSDEAKTHFLRAMYDDEGSVVVNNKVILLKQCKSLNNLDSLKLFLGSLGRILSNFGIDSKIVYVRYGNNKIEATLKIYGYDNILSFSEKINFRSEVKQEKLKRLLSSYKRMVSQHNKLTENIKIDLDAGLHNKDMATKYKKRTSTISYHLNKIRSKNN